LPLYVVAEKILGPDEALPADWAAHGTSGYDFINVINALFIDAESKGLFNRLYQDWIDDRTRFREAAYQKKELILRAAMASELHMLTRQLDRLAQKSRRSRDFTFNALRAALRETISCFPLYRSYISDSGARDSDRRMIELATRRAAIRNPLLNRSLFLFVRNTLLAPPAENADTWPERRHFAGKFQQVTAPVTAKGIEDTAFYVYTRLLSINEVGGEPDRFGLPVETIHGAQQQRQAKWPYGLSPLSTHDTKRSEDVRARINVLSEMADDWWKGVARWARLNEPHRRQIDEMIAPDPGEENLLYQTLLGAWPLQKCTPEEFADFVLRIQAYMTKALHEAKVHTSWINPNAEYDRSVQEFVGRILNAGSNGAFLEDFSAFVRRVSHYGLYNSLSQTLLRITAPGVPDTYQGTELWDFSLVDPDNRRPVDYECRQQLLRDLQRAAAPGQDLLKLVDGLVAAKEDGRIKLYTTYRALHCRRDRPGLFSAGEYLPLAVTGEKAGHLFAFARRTEQASAVVAVPRLLTRLTTGAHQPPLGRGVWRDTRLLLTGTDAAMRWRNVFTGEVLSSAAFEGQRALAAGEILAHFPVALLVGTV
jgi:(1->4)-alpha-D-glucan 1-alpha-D-glucosylmutase